MRKRISVLVFIAIATCLASCAPSASPKLKRVVTLAFENKYLIGAGAEYKLNRNLAVGVNSLDIVKIAKKDFGDGTHYVVWGYIKYNYLLIKDVRSWDGQRTWKKGKGKGRVGIQCEVVEDGFGHMKPIYTKLTTP